MEQFVVRGSCFLLLHPVPTTIDHAKYNIPRVFSAMNETTYNFWIETPMKHVGRSRSPFEYLENFSVFFRRKNFQVFSFSRLIVTLLCQY